MEFEEAIRRMDRHKVATALHAFDGHSFVVRRGLVYSATRGADSIEHHDGIGFRCADWVYSIMP